METLFFQTRSVLLDYGIAKKQVKSLLLSYVAFEEKEYSDTDDAAELLLRLTDKIQHKMVDRLSHENSYESFLKLLWIFDEIHSRYLAEKAARVKLVENRIDDEGINDVFGTNRNIMRYIIDSCNVWIENCTLLQHEVDSKSVNTDKMFVLDKELFVDLFLYGIASHTLSLLMLSKNKDMHCPYYGISVDFSKDIPIEPIKYHPFIYYNTAITGNQNVLSEVPLTSEANETAFGKGFKNETNVEFLLFLAVLHGFQYNMFSGDDKALNIVPKADFIKYVESYTNPQVSGKDFYNHFVLKKDKIKAHLKKNEKIIWTLGVNKNRYELRPFIELDDDRIIISYGALEQAKQLWVSYQSNGGMCYTSPAKSDPIKMGMEIRNKELSDLLVKKIQEVLQKHYEPEVDLVDVRYDRIFGSKEEDYGDYDLVFYSEKQKVLFLIEAKYFSDSLNASGTVTDFEKMYKSGGYYDHCRGRYDLVMSEQQKLKDFVGATDKIELHMLFVSSKPLEMELKDEDDMVTILPLGILEKYIEGKLLDGETGEVVKTDWRI